MPDIFHMHTYLVCAPCFQMKFGQRIFFSCRQPFIMSYCRLPGFEIYLYGDQGAFHSCDRSVDRSGVRKKSVYKCEISPENLTLFHLN